VFRLVSRGTVEELKYLRQVYKTQLKQETIVDVANEDRETSARLFRGVAGDKTRKGELFGLANLLKFREGTFMNYASDTTTTRDSRKYEGLGAHRTEDILDTVKEMSEEDIEEIGSDGNVFADIAMQKSKGRVITAGPFSFMNIIERLLTIILCPASSYIKQGR
jgi:hypothetical protein